MKISVHGCGYVGLVTGACFAETGVNVICLDTDRATVTRLQRGDLHIHEPGLEDLVRRNLESGRLRFSADVREAVEHGEAQFITVSTPPGGNGEADLRQVFAVAESIAAHMSGHRLVACKSTVPVGTCAEVEKRIAAALAERGADHEFDVVSNPEFLKGGAAVSDFMHPERIIVGTGSRRAIDFLSALYAPFHRKRDRLRVMDRASAELTKYAANAMLATRVSFMNELAGLAERGRGRHRAGARGDGRGQAHRLQLPVRGLRLWRFLPAQGHRRAGADRARTRLPQRDRRGGSERQRSSESAAGRKDPGPFRRFAGGPPHRAMGPVVQAGYRRHTRGPPAWY